MDEMRVRALIDLGLDEQQAKAAIKTLNDMNGGLKDVDKQAQQAQRQLRAVAEQGEKMRNVGVVMAGLGAGIIGPLTLLANEYAQRYKGLEKQANDYNRSVQRSTNATTAIGRQAASALIPVMNRTADFLENLSRFAQQHPEVMRAAMTAGAGLVAGGGALAMAGTAVSTIARLMELLKAQGGISAGIGGLLGTVTKGVASLGLLAAGAEGAVIGLNKLGEATGNQYLAQYRLSDALKTGREIIATAVIGLSKAFIDAKATWGRLQDIISGTVALVGNKVDSMVDRVATEFRKVLLTLRGGLGRFMNGILDLFAAIANKADPSNMLGMNDVAQKLRKAKDPNASRGYTGQEQSGYDLQARQEDAQFQQREAERAARLKAEGDRLAGNDQARQRQYEQDMANLAKLTKDILVPFADTGSLGTTIDSAVKPVTDKIAGLLSGIGNLFSGGAGSGGATGAGSPEAVRAYIDRVQKQAESDRQYEADKKRMVTEFNAAQAKAERDHAAELLKVRSEQSKAESELVARQGIERQKIASDYSAGEAEINRRAEFEREQRAKAHTARLKELEFSRDVEAYRQEQDSYKQQAETQAAQADFEHQERAAKFIVQLKEQDDQDRRELDQLRQQGRDKADELQAQFDREAQDRQAAYDEQSRALAQKHQDEKTSIDTAYAGQLASLSGNLAGTNSLYTQYYANASAAALDYINRNQTYLQQLYKSSMGPLASGATGGSVQPAYATRGSDVNTLQALGAALSLPNAATVYNTSSSNANTTVNATFGDNVTADRLDQMVRNVHRAFRTAT